MSVNRLQRTAFHEAGHAIAVALSGGKVVSISLDPGKCRYYINENDSDGFIAYAGPWAAARFTGSDVFIELHANPSDYADVVKSSQNFEEWDTLLENNFERIRQLAIRVYVDYGRQRRRQMEKRRWKVNARKRALVKR